MSRLMPSRLTVVQAVLLVVAALLGAVLVPRLAPVDPSLVLPVVVAGALRGGRATGALLGVSGGWLIDLIPPGTDSLGLTALTYAAAGALAGTLHHSLRHSPLLPMVGMLGAALLLHGVRLLADLLDAVPLDLVGAGASVLTATVLGALVVPALIHHETRMIERGRA